MILEHALDYARRGFRVMPLHTPQPDGSCSCRNPKCDSVGKHPRTMAGLKDATTDQAQIAKWWDMWPTANVGIATGAESNLVVLDIDPRHGGTESVKTLQAKHGQFAEKVWANTGGGGWHILFAHPGVKVRNIQNRPDKLGAGVDVRGDGGYIVAPPSLHASGNLYSWGCELPERLPQMPAWLRDLLCEPERAEVLRDAEAGDVPEGARNNTLTSLAGSMRRRGMDEAEIYAAISAVNERRCNPPLEDEAVRKIANSVSRYQPDDPAFVFPEKVVPEGQRPDGIHFVSDFRDRVRHLYRSGMRGGLSTGIPALDWNYTVKPGQWTVVTGMPSHGKSAVLDQILHNLADLHGWKMAITSIENQPLERHAAQLLSLHAGEPFGKGDVPRMSEATMEGALDWLDEHFVFILPDEGGCTVSGILDRVEWADANHFEVQGVVVDPWNELEHRRPANMTETEYVSQSLTRLRRFARAKNKHLWLVAHPTKLQKDLKTGNYPVPTLYDISGSAHFRNKADMGLSVWRDVTNEGTATEIHVQKVRFRECGKVGKVELYFDIVTGRYSELPADQSRHFYSNEQEKDYLGRM